MIAAQKEAESHGTLHSGGQPSVRDMFEGVYAGHAATSAPSAPASGVLSHAAQDNGRGDPRRHGRDDGARRERRRVRRGRGLFRRACSAARKGFRPSTARPAASMRRSTSSGSWARQSAWRPMACAPASRSSSPTMCTRPTIRSSRRPRGCATAPTRHFTCPLVMQNADRRRHLRRTDPQPKPRGPVHPCERPQDGGALESARRQGIAHRGNRGPRSGDLPGAEAALQWAVRRSPRPARDAVVEARAWRGRRTATTRAAGARPPSGAKGAALTILAYGTMVHVALAAAAETGVDAEIIDLRTLLPLDLETIEASVRKTGRCVIVHEATLTSGFGAELCGAGAGDLLLSSRSARSARGGLGHALSARAGMGLLPRPRPRSAARCSRRWRRKMAEHVIRLPDVGEGIAEAELVEWHVKVGDLVREDAVACRRDDRQGDGRNPVAGRGRDCLARRRGRRPSRRRLRSGPAESSGKGQELAAKGARKPPKAKAQIASAAKSAPANSRSLAPPGEGQGEGGLAPDGTLGETLTPALSPAETRKSYALSKESPLPGLPRAHLSFRIR